MLARAQLPVPDPSRGQFSTTGLAQTACQHAPRDYEPIMRRVLHRGSSSQAFDKQSAVGAGKEFWRDWLETLTFTGADQCHYLRPSRDQALSPCKSDRWRIFFFTVIPARPHHSQSAQAAVKGALPPPPPALSAPPSMRLPLTACFSACCAQANNQHSSPLVLLSAASAARGTEYYPPSPFRLCMRAA